MVKSIIKIFFNSSLFKEDIIGETDWIEMKPVSGDWDSVNLDQFSLCFWMYNKFYNEDQRFAKKVVSDTKEDVSDTY